MALVGLVAAAVFLAPHSGVTARGEEAAVVGSAVEAWYRVAVTSGDGALCILPCPEVAAPAVPRPERTLHVGMAGGREQARTYVALDLTGLPGDNTITGGVVRMPVAGSDAGTMAPSLARLVACTVEAPVDAVEGGAPEDAPATDCTAATPLEFNADADAFTLDLSVLAAEMSTSDSLAFAVVASDEAREQGGTWWVAFHGRERRTEDAQPITAELTYRATAPAVPAPPTPAGQPGSSRIEGPLDAMPSPSLTSEPLPAPMAMDEEVTAGAPRAPEPGRFLLPRGIARAFPQVWLLPLAFLLIGGILVRSLTAPYEVDV